MFSSDSIFSRFMNRLFDILYTGILWVLFSLPIVTAGAAATAAYYAMAKCVRHSTGYIGREFWHSFKSNFKQSLPLTFGFAAVALVLALDIWYVWGNDIGKVGSALFMVFVFFVFLASGIVVYIFPLLSRFEKGNLGLIKLAAAVMFKYLPVTVGILLLFAVSAVGIYLMPWAVFVIPGVYLYILSYPMEWIMRKLAPPAEEGSEEAQKWYR